MGDAPEMVKQARVLAQATSQLVNAIKGQAESHPDTDMQKRLLAAAKQLADATSNLVEAAKVNISIFGMGIAVDPRSLYGRTYLSLSNT